MADADPNLRRFVPPHPPRGQGPVASWRGFFGERARAAVYGWSDQVFGAPYLKRKVLGFTVHIPLQPALVQHVLLDNAANYVKPDIVKRLLFRTIGRTPASWAITSKSPPPNRRAIRATFVRPSGVGSPSSRSHT